MPRAGPEKARMERAIAQSPGWSEVKRSSFKEAFHHFVGKRGRGRTEVTRN